MAAVGIYANNRGGRIMTSSELIDIIQLPRPASEDSAQPDSALTGTRQAAPWPQGWPEDVVLALRREASVLSLMPCHADETAESLVTRVAHVEGRNPAAYRVYPALFADKYADDITRLLQEDEDLFERAEEFALNYEFMQPRSAANSAAASPSKDPVFLPLNQGEAAVELADLSLMIAEDGSAILHIPGGNGDWQAKANAMAQSPDGGLVRLDLQVMLDAGINAGEVQLPVGSFVFRKIPYTVSRRGTALYFSPSTRHPETAVPGTRWRQQAPLFGVVAALLLLSGLLLGLLMAPQPIPTAPAPPVEALRQSLFAPE